MSKKHLLRINTYRKRAQEPPRMVIITPGVLDWRKAYISSWAQDCCLVHRTSYEGHWSWCPVCMGTFPTSCLLTSQRGWLYYLLKSSFSHTGMFGRPKGLWFFSHALLLSQELSLASHHPSQRQLTPLHKANTWLPWGPTASPEGLECQASWVQALEFSLTSTEHSSDLCNYACFFLRGIGTYMHMWVRACMREYMCVYDGFEHKTNGKIHET